MFQEVGGLYGVSERGGWFEVRALTAWGRKLLSSLAARALMLRNRHPDGRSWKRLWEGWVGSFTILFALLDHYAHHGCIFILLLIPLLPCLVSHDPLEIIILCWFGAQETFVIVKKKQLLS